MEFDYNECLDNRGRFNVAKTKKHLKDIGLKVNVDLIGHVKKNRSFQGWTPRQEEEVRTDDGTEETAEDRSCLIDSAPYGALTCEFCKFRVTLEKGEVIKAVSVSDKVFPCKRFRGRMVSMHSTCRGFRSVGN